MKLIYLVILFQSLIFSLVAKSSESFECLIVSGIEKDFNGVLGDTSPHLSDPEKAIIAGKNVKLLIHGKTCPHM